MRHRLMCAGLVLGAGAATAAGQSQTGEVIITEILYATSQNFLSVPALDERFQEYIELYNTTDNPIDVSGWYIADDGVTDPFPDGTIIPARGTLVVCGNDGDTSNDFPGNVITPEIFAAAWEPNPFTADGSVNVIVLGNFETLSNSPNPVDNEILQLFTADGELQDEVNYDDAAPWPTDSPQGLSIHLLPQFLNAIDNDSGCSWGRADRAAEAYPTNEVAVDENYQVVPAGTPGSVIMFFGPGGDLGPNFGSPGYVEVSGDFQDCNGNGIDDIIDICSGFSQDCNNNGIPDECEPDCNNNGIPDDCEILLDPVNNDCNGNGLLDECEIADNPNLDLNGNGILDVCEAAGAVIITEIMFNPPTREFESEWVEIMNVSSEPIDISGWFIGDLEETGRSEPIAPGVVLDAGEVAVLINDYRPDNTEPGDLYFGVDPEAEFRLSWEIPSTTKVIPIVNFGSRANSAAAGDEILTLFDAAGVPSDIVDYISDNSLDSGWPKHDGTASIYLKGSGLSSGLNNNGSRWALSLAGVAGAYSPNGLDELNNSVRSQGSPGVVSLTDPEPVAREVIITEIHSVSNPIRQNVGIGPNGEPDQLVFLPNEFVEILNVSSAPVDISGWFLRDEDGLSETVPPGTVLGPGEAAVLYQADVLDAGNFFGFANRFEAIRAFYDAWGCGYQVIPLTGWGAPIDRLPDSRGLNNLANGPGESNEILTLRDADGGLVDLVNYDDDGIVWPFDGTGDPALEAFSVYLLPGSYEGADNDSGFNWAASFVTFDDARNNTITDIFNGPGGVAASPGAVSGVVIPDLNDCQPLPCSLADVAEPFGVINFFDLSAYITLFNAQDPAADLAGPFGTLNFFDVAAYVDLFNQGCP